jgi:two-component system response regulator FixJ
VSAIVYIVDDDDMVRDSLALLLEGAGYRVRAFESGEAFLASAPENSGGCLLLDVAMPGMSGLEVQEELQRRNVSLPVLFLTAHGDVPTAVRAVKAGAVDFLQKPFEGKALLARVAEVQARDEERTRIAAEVAVVMARYDSLTPRERDVMALAATGQHNKEIARELGISYRTVEIHRARLMHKMGAASLVELAEMARICRLGGPAQGIGPPQA